MPYFDDPQAARAYERSRPFFHPLVMQRMQSFLALERRVERALDVACGSGQSARAVCALATHVVALDRSQPMLREAARPGGVALVASRAEQLPLAAGSFDLITVALAFHWFAQDQFLREAHRVLRPGGWLVIYDNAFLGMMAERSAFQRWFRQVYLARYPPPARGAHTPIENQCAPLGLAHLGSESYGNFVEFTPTELAAYLCTQSNVRAAVESGEETIDNAVAWISESVSPCFAASRGTFAFGGVITYLAKGGHE